MLSGKTTRILSRFPDFYISEDPSDLLHQLVNIFGEMLDRTEADLTGVMRSHFVDTAENTGSQGFLTDQKGDLDRIFTLYLEKLGGTAQLMQVNLTFQSTDIRQLSTFIRELLEAETPIAQYIWDQFPPHTQHLLNRYAVVNVRFPQHFLLALPPTLLLLQEPTVLDLYLKLSFPAEVEQALRDQDKFEAIRNAAIESPSTVLTQLLMEQAIALTEVRNILIETAFNQTLVQLAIQLIARQDAFTRYGVSQLTSKTRQQLEQYDGANPVPLTLKQSLAEDFNHLLKNPFLYAKFQDYLIQIQIGQTIQDAIDSPIDRHITALAQSLRKRLTLAAQKPLFALAERDAIAPQSRTLWIQELTVLFSDPHYCRQLLEAIAPTQVNAAAGLALSERAIAALLQAARTALSNLLKTDDFSLPQLTPEAERLLAQKPIGEDLERFNRMVLETVYFGSILPSASPPAEDAQTALALALNDRILTDSQFYLKNRSSFAEIPLTAEAKTLIGTLESDVELPLTSIQRLNRLLLEAAFPTYLEKSYAPYRERLRRLITVLKNGASSKEGIVDIVAANLGISITQPDEIRPWEAFLFNLPLSVESALVSLTASPKLRQAFADRETLLSYSATVAMEQPQRRWVITDINTSQVYVVRRQTNDLSVHRQLIRVIEFLPQSQTFNSEVHPQPQPLADQGENLTFTIANPNLLETIPAIQVKLRDHRPDTERMVGSPVRLGLEFQATLDRLSISQALRQTLVEAEILLSAEATVEPIQAHQQWRIRDLSNRQTYTVLLEENELRLYRQEVLPPLTNVRLVNQTTSQSVQYTGTIACDEVLLFLPDGTILLNGKIWRSFDADGAVLINGQVMDDPSPEFVSRIPPLPLGSSTWHIESSIGYARATFEQTLFDFSLFEQVRLDPVRPNQAMSYIFEVSVTLYRLTPGSFLVKIPWDIPGYTDRFDENRDHPRHKIHALINRVKAVGMRSVIAYEKQFQELHELGDFLAVKRSPFTETHELEEYNFDLRSLQKPYEKGLEHEMEDTLVTSAVFDYTRFDSLNQFS